MAKFMLLLYGNENVPQTEEELKAEYDAYGVFTGIASERSTIHSAEALQMTGSARTVRVRTGAMQVTDGPFAETKEQLGGFYLIDAADIDEAVELARHVPAAFTGSVEVRPVVMFE